MATTETSPAGYKANQDVFAETVGRLAGTDKNIIVVTSDSRGSGKLVNFGKQFPKQIVEVGIAEQNLVGVAAGLASCAKKVFAVSPACFLSARALEQIKNDVAYSNNPVNVIGISAGVSYGALGSTHHSLHDFAVLRAINNIIIAAPADNFETAQAAELASKTNLPVYLRFGKKAMPALKEINDDVFVFGKGRVITEGEDIAIIASGETVYPALKAAEKLKEQG
ncbi:MAG TPA: transketolase C-terminal domain-containing protein, partial [Chitinophagaceae bacterium]